MFGQCIGKIIHKKKFAYVGNSIFDRRLYCVVKLSFKFNVPLRQQPRTDQCIDLPHFFTIQRILVCKGEGQALRRNGST
ncbi:Uncharacterised protein [Achromobacter xylosoxidans]|nr:Uncharacterised protein [Achromobacter xylosoxidans]